MSEDDAHRLAQFIKDHDKRFVARAHPDGAASVVVLTRADDGTPLEPIAEVFEYEAEQITGDDPGPTVRQAWQKWGAALQHRGTQIPPDEWADVVWQIGWTFVNIHSQLYSCHRLTADGLFP